MSLSGLYKYLRLRPFDQSTESGRNSERYRLALWSVIANVGSKGIAMAVMVLSVSMTLPYLGAERFGVWMTIASLVGMLVFLDLGVGNALINTVVAAAAKAQAAEAARKKESFPSTFPVGLRLAHQLARMKYPKQAKRHC